MSFIKITVEVAEKKEALRQFLLETSQVAKSRRGDGVFLAGKYGADTSGFRQFGIPVQGAIIVPVTGDVDGEVERVKQVAIQVIKNDRQKYQDTLTAAETIRAKAEDDYLGQVAKLLEKYQIPGLAMMGCADKRGNCSWGAAVQAVMYGNSHEWVNRRTFLAVNGDAALMLRNESYSENMSHHVVTQDVDTRVAFTPLEEVEQFLRAESGINPLRRQYLARLQALIAKNERMNQYRETCGGFTYILFDGKMSGGIDFYPISPGLQSAHKVRYYTLWPAKGNEKTCDFREEDIAVLEQMIAEEERAVQSRLDFLRQLFQQASGVFTKIQEDRWDEDGKYKENVYFVNGERTTQKEYKWLISHRNEFAEAPTGFVRVPNDTNEILPILDIPGRNDVLVVEGKTGSRRGEWSYGEWFCGHPSECQISFWHKGTARKIKTVTLNGQIVESNWVDLDKWKDPKKLAEWALKQAGMELSPERTEALAEAYQRLKK